MARIRMPPQARRRANALMPAQCVIRRPTGDSHTDPDTHVVTPALEVIYGPDAAPFYGKCKLQAFAAFEQERESAGITQIINRLRVDLPSGAVLVKPNDMVTVVRAADLFLVGMSYRLTVQAPYKSHMSAYRVYAELNVGMEVPSWP